MASVSELSPRQPPREMAVAGRVIAGRYRLEAPVGTGGMATVWRATHLTLNQPIALKFIEVVGMDASGLRDRFLREARVAAAIRHRNVVDILDFGTSDEGQPFMAMELLEGESLGERMVRQPPMTVGESVRAIARVLSGLGAVHDAGIMHRDLKPENIFLVKDADGVYPKLIDFGVSRALDASTGIQSVLPTVENAIAGTPQYMSPEQARGLPGLDHRSDLWSAGVMLFELLTGRLPYDGEAAGDVIIKIATEDPPDFARLRPDLAGPVEAVVKRAMAKDPDARFATAREMRAVLLAAVATTASRMHATGQSGARVLDTYDDVDAAELFEAIGDSYEKGDSGLIDMNPQLDVIDALLPAVPAGPGAPPAHVGVGEDPFESADRAALDTLDAVAPSLRRSRAWIVALGIFVLLLIVGGVGAVVLWQAAGRDEIVATELLGDSVPEPVSAPEVAPEPPPEPPPEPDPSEVGPMQVTLTALPEGAAITLDGSAWSEGSPLRVPRDGQPHTIEVQHTDGRTWSVTHAGDEDGQYAVELPPAAARPTRPGRRRPPRPRPGRAGGELIRNPGF